MNELHLPLLRHLRRAAGLTQDDVARILGVGGRSYVAMLESGDRVPHARDVVLLSMLFGTEEKSMFPQLYLTTKELFQSNARKLIEAALADGGHVETDNIRHIRSALSDLELSANVEPQIVC